MYAKSKKLEEKTKKRLHDSIYSNSRKCRIFYSDRKHISCGDETGWRQGRVGGKDDTRAPKTLRVD